MQQQNMAPQAPAQDQAQSQATPTRRGPFPWLRLLCAVGIVMLLALLFALSVLSTGHIITYIWVILAAQNHSWCACLLTFRRIFGRLIIDRNR